MATALIERAPLWRAFVLEDRCFAFASPRTKLASLSSLTLPFGKRNPHAVRSDPATRARTL